MGRKWLEELITKEYIPFIEKQKNTPRGKNALEQFTQEIRSYWASRNLISLSQQQGCMDTLRRSIKDILGEDHWSLNHVKFSTEEYVELNNQKQGKIASRNESVQQIHDPDAIVAQAVRLLHSPEWADIAAGLAVLTGRRVAEILSTAQFTKKTQWSVIFTGALKRKGETQKLSFEIPTLTTADRVIKALSTLRKALPDAAGLPPAEINKRYERGVALACNKHFAQLIPFREGKDNLYTHLFRAIYATIATFWYCPPTVVDWEFKAAIQGHYAILDEANPELRRSIAASRHYSDYEIADEVIAQHQGKRKGIKLGISGIQPIEQFYKKQPELIEVLTTASTTTQKRKIRSSLRVYQEDKTLFAELIDKLGIADKRGNQLDHFGEFLLWAKSQIDSKPAEASPVPPNPVDDKIEKLLGAIGQLVELQASGQKPAPENTAMPLPPKPIRKQLQPDANRDTPKAEGPKRSSSVHTVQIINRAIDAIIAWNNVPGRLHDDKWAITINALKAYSPAQPRIIQILQDREAEISKHHNKHQIDPAKHNLRHRRKQKINEVIVWE